MPRDDDSDYEPETNNDTQENPREEDSGNGKGDARQTYTRSQRASGARAPPPAKKARASPATPPVSRPQANTGPAPASSQAAAAAASSLSALQPEAVLLWCVKNSAPAPPNTILPLHFTKATNDLLKSLSTKDTVWPLPR